MDLAFPSLVLTIGLLALVFDRKVAIAMNCFSIAAGNLWPQWRWPTALPAWSRERFRNYLWFMRLWAVFMILNGADCVVRFVVTLVLRATFLLRPDWPILRS
ncbi:MAG: hypothetical protein DMG39_05120 [Acidobacteria bacterium]|nr:MAG: hypothetical protein DMG39_05120 [Acidobacteriota bacterium]